MNILSYMENNILIADGAFGTYYESRYGSTSPSSPELANIMHPEQVYDIHADYIRAGAQLIRTNTFAANKVSLGMDMEDVCAMVVDAAIETAKRAVRKEGAAAGDIYVAGDIGPVPQNSGLTNEEMQRQYIAAGERMIAGGVDIIWFETFPDFEVLEPVVRHLKSVSDIPVMVSFCVNQFGYSSSGFSANALLRRAAADENTDCVGLNCGVGPYHMLQLVKKLDMALKKPVSIMPNAGYPRLVRSRLTFSDNKVSFAEKTAEIAALGAYIVGGCCGTNPQYIEEMGKTVQRKRVQVSPAAFSKAPDTDACVPKDNFITSGRAADPKAKLIAVELAPPFDDNDEKLLDAAHILKREKVDVVTFPDSPSGRTRADSILMAEKVARETGLTVMPHLCCRDKNAIAIRASVLGAQLNGIKNFLVITGDPVPVMFRQTTRSVFNFDSVGMMKLLQTMNDEVLGTGKITYGGAINQNRLNKSFELDRIKKKLAAGAEFFLTQPVFSREQAQVLRDMKRETGALILVGIMPLVSRKNALFMKNEMAGIEIPDDVIERYGEAFSRAEGEQCGVSIAREIIGYTEDFADGYYFSFPFNRVHMLGEILQR